MYDQQALQTKTSRPAPIINSPIEEKSVGKDNKRKCGCERTSEKLKKILGTFPAPSPGPLTPKSVCMLDKASGYSYGHSNQNVFPPVVADCCRQTRIIQDIKTSPAVIVERKTIQSRPSKSWQFITELVALVQLSVTATALALYYLIYCYMHLIYFTLRSAMYFHNADGPMKITIAVVTVTSIIFGLHILTRMQRLIGFFY